MSFEQIISFSLDDGTPFTADPIFVDTLVRLRPLVQSLLEEIEEGRTSYLRLPFEATDLASMEPTVKSIQENFNDVIVLGTGGSSLGAQALCGLIDSKTEASAQYPKLHFPDNLNARAMTTMLSEIDFGTTHFVVISKSGNTVETLVQAALCISGVKAALVESEIHKHFSVIVGSGDSALRRLAEFDGLSCFNHIGDLCGRFSVFSNVGLLPAMIAGLDAAKVRNGAKDTLGRLIKMNNPVDAPAAQAAAAIDYLNRTHGVGITVMMPYDKRLDPFSRWLQQLWSESLGKSGKGTTPLRAMGPADQHSQLQLFLDGPRDKFFTTIAVDTVGKGPKITAELAGIVGLDYLVGRTVGDIVAAESDATIQSLIGSGRPVREIRIAKLDERTLGSLMMSFMVETVLTAGLIGVNAFDQPAVEEGKRLTIQHLESSKSKS